MNEPLQDCLVQMDHESGVKGDTNAAFKYDIVRKEPDPERVSRSRSDLE